MDWSRALISIERFERMARLNLRELQLLHRDISENSKLEDSICAVSSKREASLKIDQLMGGLQQILNLRNQLSYMNQELFDDRIEPIRIQIQTVVNALNTVITTNNKSAEQNMYDDLYEQSLRSYETEKSEPQRMKINSLRLRAEQAKMDAAETKKLASDIDDLNEVMMQLAQLVHTQHEVVDSIEEHIEKAQLDVHGAHKNLRKAQTAKTAKYPIVAAAVGSVALGGPVGIVAGSTVAGICAAVGGAIAGLYSGRFLRHKTQELSNRGDGT